MLQQGGRLEGLFNWYEALIMEGKKYGYYVNKKKCWLIVKSEELAKEAQNMFGESVNITTAGKRHLGAVIGSKEYKDEYCIDKVKTWSDELKKLAEIAKTQPQAAYIAFTKGYRSKFTYFMRTIPGFEDYIEPVRDILNDLFVPTLFGQEEPMSDALSSLFSLPPRDGGLGIPLVKEETRHQHIASILITESHVEAILEQRMTMAEDSRNTGADSIAINEHKERSKVKYEEKKKLIDSQLPEVCRTAVEQARDKGASSWLTAIPLEQQGFQLNKEEFRDSLRLRYSLPLQNLPRFCPCGQSFTVEHALSCKKGGFITLRHDTIRDVFTTQLDKVCHNVQAEPHLIPLDGETFDLRSANTSEEARLDIKATGFWRRGQTAFFDVRVTHVNSASNRNQSTESVFLKNENEKKRAYLQRVIEVEQGTFTPLVLGTNGGMGQECAVFIKHLAAKLAEKESDSYSSVITMLQTKLSFEILKSALLCIRGTRYPWKKRDNPAMEDFTLIHEKAEVK